MNRVEILCCQGSAKYNEDIIGFTANGLWVIDGATGLNNKNLVSNTSDAKWYVNWWNEYLYENINKDENLKDIIKEGIKQIDKEYKSKLKDVVVSKLDKPSSGICIVKKHEKKLEYLILGDCSLHIMSKNKVTILTDEKLCELDDELHNEMKNLPQFNQLSHEQIKEQVMDKVISTRLKKNAQDGYWILEFEEEAVDNAIYGNIDIQTNMSIMLASDGFSCVSDRYELIDEKELIKEVKNYGISDVYIRLRKFEEEELSIYNYPRFKIKDDSSCIYLEINPS